MRSLPNDQRSPLRPTFSTGWRKSIFTGVASELPPSPNETVAVWVGDVATLLASPANFRILTETDRASLLRIQAASARDSAIAARILLRLALSISANRRLAPDLWSFERTELGRPSIKVAGNPEQFDFSVSHAEELVVVAIGRNVRLGVDIESADQPLEKSLVSAFCHPSESETLQLLAPNLQHRSFVQLWTEKEAYTKMLGLGHSLEFNSFKVEQSRDTPATSAITEGFYIPRGHLLYYASLAITRPSFAQNITVELVTAALNEPAQLSQARAAA